MKPVILLLVFNFLIGLSLSGQEIKPLNSYLQELEVKDPQRATHLQTLFYKNVPSVYVLKDRVNLNSEHNPLKVEVARAYYDKIDNKQINLSETEMLVIKFYKQNDLQFKLNELILNKMPGLKYVVFVGEFDFAIADLQKILPTISKDIVFMHVKSIPS